DRLAAFHRGAGVGQRQRLQGDDAQQADRNDQHGDQHLHETETGLALTRTHSQLPSPSSSGFEMTTRLPEAMLTTRLFCGGLFVSTHTVMSPAISCRVTGSRAMPSGVKVIMSSSELTFSGSRTENSRSCSCPPPAAGPITAQKGCSPSSQSASLLAVSLSTPQNVTRELVRTASVRAYWMADSSSLDWAASRLVLTMPTKDGTATAARMATMVTVTISSTTLNPRRRFSMGRIMRTHPPAAMASRRAAPIRR